MDSESQRLISACRKDPDLSNRKDLLALFVQTEEENNFSSDFLRDVVVNFVIAGRDTTACTLSWMFYILSINPDVQERLCDEIDRKCPAGSRRRTIADLSPSEMPYLHGVLYETLRLYPPVPMNMKESADEDTLPDGTYVPKHVNLTYLPYAMGRDPVRYANPEQVKPERWIPWVVPSQAEFPVFQAGPRVCLGMDMAIFEAKLVAVALLQRYSFKLMDGEAENICYSNTLTMSVCNSLKQDSHSLWLIPKKREPRP
jgi:cytochrome P450